MPEVNPHKHNLIQLSSDYWDGGSRCIYWCTHCGCVKDFMKIYDDPDCKGDLFTYELGASVHVSKERMVEFDAD